MLDRKKFARLVGRLTTRLRAGGAVQASPEPAGSLERVDRRPVFAAVGAADPGVCSGCGQPMQFGIAHYCRGWRP
jgi:hypothetical protein